MENIKKYLVPFLILLIDQTLKNLVFYKSIRLDFIIFQIQPVVNKGTIWGLFNHEKSNLVFILISFVVILVFVHYKKYLVQELQSKYFFILAGITSNLIDRITHGFVIDYIDFKFWPVFNLADAMISLSVLIYLIEKVKYYFLKRG